MTRPVTPPPQPPAHAAVGWLPHPGLSALLAGVWLLLQQSLAMPQLIVALLLGWAVPRLLRGFLADGPAPAPPPADPTGPHQQQHQRVRPGWRVPVNVARLTARVLHDIVAGNLAVARLVLWPGAHPRPGWVTVPLDLSHPDATVLLALVITNTPGTVSCGIDAAARQIVVHVLDLDDPAALVAQIKQRYEQPIREIFRC